MFEVVTEWSVKPNQMSDFDQAVAKYKGCLGMHYKCINFHLSSVGHNSYRSIERWMSQEDKEAAYTDVSILLARATMIACCLRVEIPDYSRS